MGILHSFKALSNASKVLAGIEESRFTGGHSFTGCLFHVLQRWDVCCGEVDVLYGVTGGLRAARTSSVSRLSLRRCFGCICRRRFFCRCRRGLQAVPKVVVAHHLCCRLQSESQRITHRYPGYPFALCSRAGPMVGLVVCEIMTVH